MTASEDSGQFHGVPVQGAPLPGACLIGELGRLAGLEPKTVRFYERKGLIAPQRIGKMRLFTAHDVERLKSIKALRGLGMPITSIRTLLKSCRYIDFSNPPAEVKAAIEEALQEQRERLEQLEGQFKNMFEEQEPRQSCELNGG